MKHLLRIFGILLCLFGALPSMADETRLQHLVSQAEAAIARDDRQAADRLIDEIYELTTGFDASVDGKPENLSKADYEKIICPYRKALVPLLTAEEIEYGRHEMRLFALQTILFNREDHPYVSAILECIHDNGEPALEARALRDGLVWAKKMNAANIDELQIMLQEYEALAKQYPEYELYQLLHENLDFKIDSHRAANESKELKQRLKDIDFQKELVEKAAKGSLAAQLEVARRLETGDIFKHDNHLAYFWYKLALQNDGREAAQSGIDRLLPHLNEFELEWADWWLKTKHHPY